MLTSTMAIYSHSRLKVYESCPRRYRYQYVDRLEPPDTREAIELYLGSRVHEALEALYQELGHGRLLRLDELIARFRHHWKEQWPASVRLPRPDDEPAVYRAAGERCLADYYMRYQPFDSDRTVAVERRLLFPLDAEGEVLVQGYVDRLSVGSDGVWTIHDYKTSRYLPTQQQIDTDRQLPLYEIGVRHAWPDVREVKLVWHFLAHDVKLCSRRSAEDLAEVRHDALKLIGVIEADQEFQTDVGRHCDWCPYRAICPAWRHLEESAQQPAERFAEDAGVQLVDSYARLKAHKHSLATELDAVQTDLVAFAEQQGLERVRGTRHVITLEKTTAAQFPAKGAEARPILERLLKEHGLWEEVSELSVRTLARMLNAGRWPRALLDTLRGFATQAKAVRVRLAKLQSGD